MPAMRPVARRSQTAARPMRVPPRRASLIASTPEFVFGLIPQRYILITEISLTLMEPASVRNDRFISDFVPVKVGIYFHVFGEKTDETANLFGARLANFSE